METANKRSFSWIQNAVLPHSPSYDPEIGVTVGHCLRNSYPAYLKIFHPIYADSRVQDKTMTWDEWEKAGLGKAASGYREATTDMTTMDQAILVSSPYLGDRDGLSRVSWRELAERYGLFFQRDFNGESFRAVFTRSWPRYLSGPAEGFLDLSQYSVLVSILASVTPPQFIYLKLPDMWQAGDAVERLFRGSIEEIAEFLRERSPVQSPEYLWPEDRSWCVNSEDDLSFTLVGGSSRVINEIAQNKELETLAVDPGTRVDYKADRINLSGPGKTSA